MGLDIGAGNIQKGKILNQSHNAGNLIVQSLATADAAIRVFITKALSQNMVTVKVVLGPMMKPSILAK